MKSSARYSVGMDLGTTHTALAYRPIGESGQSTVFQIPQLVRSGEVEPRPLLPSFLYLPHPAELPRGSTALPWRGEQPEVVGEWARALGALTPLRLVSSAKSWLSHPALDRRAASLPAGSPPEVPKISPLDASARYLEHLRASWSQVVAKGDPALALEAQELTLTVPASFDAVARELTVEAARKAGLGEVTLLEEPQAALYAWVDAMGDRWRRELHPGDLVLVVDVGGGTTDFSLIAVSERSGELELERVAVGDHILLGGDNMDLALAHALAGKLERQGRRLDRWQLLAVTHGSREAKERLFSERSLETHPVAVAGRGSSLVGGAIRTELTRAELLGVLVDGFFPEVPASARPAAQIRSGLTTLGLPYATDPAVTRHLAAFLTRHRATLGRESAPRFRLEGKALLHPTAILFNGGVMKARELETRVLSVVGRWIEAEGGERPRRLPETDPDLAVALGAANHGRARAGHGIRIRGGTARAYYVGIEAAMPAVPGLPPAVRAVCLAPMGMEEGTQVDLPGEEVGLVTGEAAQFRLFSSATRREDRLGDVAEDERQLAELPRVEMALPAKDGQAGQVVPVRLRAHVTELGTLELTCVDREEHAWRLEWNLRQDEPAETSGTVPSANPNLDLTPSVPDQPTCTE